MHPKKSHFIPLSLMAAGLIILGLTGLSIYPVPLSIELATGEVLSPWLAGLMQHGQVMLGLCIILAASLVAITRRYGDAWRGVSGTVSNTLLPAITGGLLALLVQQAVFDGHPHITDATSHAFQAKIFASGRLAADLPPCYEAFFQHNVIMSRAGTWHTKYFPGQALWLTPGYLIGAPWLMMPLGWFLASLAFGSIVRRVYPPPIAAGAVWVFATSPLALLLSGSFMSHSTALMFFLGALAVYLASLQTSHANRWLQAIAGLLFGFGVITRPQDMLPVLAALGAAWLLASRSVKYSVLHSAVYVATGGVVPLLILLGWNHSLYGSWIATGYNFSDPVSLTPIIRDGIGFSDRYPPALAIRYTLLTLFRFDGVMTGWPISLPIALLAFLPRPAITRWKANLVCLILIASTVILYLFFPYFGFELEARYYTMAIPGMACLVAAGCAGMAKIPGFTKLRTPVILSFVLYAYLHTWPAYLIPRFANGYEQSSRTIQRLAESEAAQTGSRLLILIPETPERDFLYSSGFPFLDPDLEGRIVYARDLPDEYECLENTFTDRIWYRYMPDQNTLIPVRPPASSSD